MLPGILIIPLQMVRNQAYKIKQGKRGFRAVQPNWRALQQIQGWTKLLMVGHQSEQECVCLGEVWWLGKNTQTPPPPPTPASSAPTRSKNVASLPQTLHLFVLVCVTNCKTDVSEEHPVIQSKGCRDMWQSKEYNLPSHYFNISHVLIWSSRWHE